MRWPFHRSRTQSRPIVGDGAFGWLKRSGIVQEGEMVRRVVIDISIDDAVLVYKEAYADGDSFNVNFPSGFSVVTDVLRGKDKAERLIAIEIKPGDTLVLMHPNRLPQLVIDNLRASMKRIFPDNKAMVLDQGMTIDALRSQDAQANDKRPSAAAETPQDG